MKKCGHESILRLIAVLGVVLALLGGGIAFAGTDTYTYDALGRLASVTYADGSTVTYTYDSAGNRTNATITGAP